MENKNLAMKVGIFLLTGVAVLAWMAIRFGRLGTGLQPYYTITVEFQNASGLLRGGDVLMSGAKVGFVKREPKLTGDGYNVTTEISLRSEVKVPLGSAFIIMSSGLMGDSYVSISPSATPAVGAGYVEPGQHVIGTRLAGLNEVTTGGLDVVDTFKLRLEDVRVSVAKINEGILGDENVSNFKAAITNLREATEGLKGTTKKLDDFLSKGADAAGGAKEAVASLNTALAKVDGVVEKADKAMSSVEAAAGDLKNTIGEVKSFATEGKKTAAASTDLIRRMSTGNGALAMLLNDSETKDDLSNLIRNIRRSGLLFYRDRPEKPVKP
jgi:phospholipid/cholesterol/gamma-HCH transport system substrate-binding protein